MKKGRKEERNTGVMESSKNNSSFTLNFYMKLKMSGNVSILSPDLLHSQLRV